MQAFIRKIVLLIIITDFFYSKVQTLKSTHIKNVVVIDIDEVKKSSILAQEIKQKSEKMLQKYREIITEIEDKLKLEKINIDKTENEEEYKKLVNKYEDKYNKFHGFVQKVKLSFDESLKKAESEWQEIVLDVIKEVLGNSEACIVISKDAIIFAKDEVDITKKVINILNKKNTHIKLTGEEDVRFEVL